MQTQQQQHLRRHTDTGSYCIELVACCKHHHGQSRLQQEAYNVVVFVKMAHLLHVMPKTPSCNMQYQKYLDLLAV
jgi:hypothetical protein